jgi:hypothetical protein
MFIATAAFRVASVYKIGYMCAAESKMCKCERLSKVIHSLAHEFLLQPLSARYLIKNLPYCKTDDLYEFTRLALRKSFLAKSLLLAPSTGNYSSNLISTLNIIFLNDGAVLMKRLSPLF